MYVRVRFPTLSHSYFYYSYPLVLPTIKMSAIASEIIKKYGLTPQMDSSQLSAYANEFCTKISDWRVRKNARTRLRDLKFSPEQISALLPDQRQQSKPATVRNKAQEIIESTDPIGEAFITNLLEGAYATPENVVTIDSRLKRLRHELRKKGAPEEIINATLDDDITRESNKKQNADRKLHARIGISPSKHFNLESINARLQSYDTAKSPNIQALADVIVMLCMRPAEVTTLQISYYEPPKDDAVNRISDSFPEWWVP